MRILRILDTETYVIPYLVEYERFIVVRCEVLHDIEDSMLLQHIHHLNSAQEVSLFMINNTGTYLGI